jgi:hypothetical protein
MKIVLIQAAAEPRETLLWSQGAGVTEVGTGGGDRIGKGGCEYAEQEEEAEAEEGTADGPEPPTNGRRADDNDLSRERRASIGGISWEGSGGGGGVGQLGYFMRCFRLKPGGRGIYRELGILLPHCIFICRCFVTPSIL